MSRDPLFTLALDRYFYNPTIFSWDPAPRLLSANVKNSDLGQVLQQLQVQSPVMGDNTRLDIHKQLADIWGIAASDEPTFAACLWADTSGIRPSPIVNKYEEIASYFTEHFGGQRYDRAQTIQAAVDFVKVVRAFNYQKRMVDQGRELEEQGVYDYAFDMVDLDGAEAERYKCGGICDTLVEPGANVVIRNGREAQTVLTRIVQEAEKDWGTRAGRQGEDLITCMAQTPVVCDLIGQGTVYIDRYNRNGDYKEFVILVGRITPLQPHAPFPAAALRS